MSASARRRELKIGDGVSLYALEEALPEIVAVVEAAENQAHRQPDLTRALAALEEKLKQ